EKQGSSRRSRFRSEKSLRQSGRPIRNAAQSPSQTEYELIFVPPNAPGPPRAIPQATWGPVYAVSTAPVASSIVPVAISPAFPEKTFTVQTPFAKLESIGGFFG